MYLHQQGWAGHLSAFFVEDGHVHRGAVPIHDSKGAKVEQQLDGLQFNGRSAGEMKRSHHPIWKPEMKNNVNNWKKIRKFLANKPGEVVELYAVLNTIGVGGGRCADLGADSCVRGEELSEDAFGNALVLLARVQTEVLIVFLCRSTT